MFTKEGRKYVLNLLARKVVANEDLKVRLGAALPGVGEADCTYATMTEASFPGYTAQTLSAQPDAAINGDNRGEAETPTVTWTASNTPASPETIYCIYVTQVEGSSGEVRVLFVWYLATPIVVNSVGDTIQRVIDFLSDNLTV